MKILSVALSFIDPVGLLVCKGPKTKTKHYITKSHCYLCTFCFSKFILKSPHTNYNCFSHSFPNISVIVLIQWRIQQLPNLSQSWFDRKNTSESSCFLWRTETGLQLRSVTSESWGSHRPVPGLLKPQHVASDYLLPQTGSSCCWRFNTEKISTVFLWFVFGHILSPIYWFSLLIIRGDAAGVQVLLTHLTKKHNQTVVKVQQLRHSERCKVSENRNTPVKYSAVLD